MPKTPQMSSMGSKKILSASCFWVDTEGWHHLLKLDHCELTAECPLPLRPLPKVGLHVPQCAHRWLVWICCSTVLIASLTGYIYMFLSTVMSANCVNCVMSVWDDDIIINLAKTTPCTCFRRTVEPRISLSALGFSTT